MNLIQSTWESTPPWVGFFILVLLVSYALVRAGYELWKEEEQAREKLQAENDTLKEGLKAIGSSTDRMSTRQSQKENERLKTENERLRAQIPQPNDEGLKQRCCELSEQLFTFLDEHAQKDPQKGMGFPGINFGNPTTRQNLNEYLQVGAHYNKETMNRYNSQFGRDVAALLGALERRGWFDPQERKKFENLRMAQNRQNIQALAQRLDDICRNY